MSFNTYNEHMIATLLAITVTAYQPAVNPTVVLVPTVNTSGEKWEDLRKKQGDKIDVYLRKEFSKRNFDVISELDVANAMKTLKFDFSDEEQQKRAFLFDLAKELKANYVYLPVIQNTEQKQQDRDLYTDKEGRTDLKIWFLDAEAQKPILSAKIYIGRSGGFRLTLKPSDRQIQAAENAVRDSLKDVWKELKIK
jgi:hypothetical protein